MGDEIPVIPELLITMRQASREIVEAGKRTHPGEMGEAEALALKITQLIQEERPVAGVMLTAVAAVFGSTLEAIMKRGRV